MPHNAAFHESLHCLLSQNGSSEKEIQYVLEVITSDPLLYTMYHPDFIIYIFMENSIGLEKNIGITHVFPCINICRVPRMLFEHEADRPSVQTSSEGPGKC